MFQFKVTRTNTVDGVLEAFHTAVTDLEAVAVAHNAKADAHAAEIGSHTAMMNAAAGEATRATGIAAKMKAIFE